MSSYRNMDWSNETILEFLRLYEEQDIIWNPKNPNHKNRTEVAQSWMKIQNSLSIECTIADLKKKKEALMATFRPLMFKVMKSSSNSSDEIYKPSWFAFDAIAKFLCDIYQPKGTINGQHSDVTDVSEDDASEDIECDQLTSSTVDFENNDSTVATFLENRKRNASSMEITEAPIEVSSKNMRVFSEKNTSPLNDLYQNMKVSAKTVIPIEYSQMSRSEKTVNPIDDMRYNINRSAKIINPPEYRRNSRKVVSEKAVTHYENSNIDNDECSLYAQLITKRLKSFDENTRTILMHDIDELIFRAKMNQSSSSNFNFPSFIGPSSSDSRLLSFSHSPNNSHFSDIPYSHSSPTNMPSITKVYSHASSGNSNIENVNYCHTSQHYSDFSETSSASTAIFLPVGAKDEPQEIVNYKSDM